VTTISLRTLLREPRKVKRLTRAGKSVQVTDNGEPLWIVNPANETVEDDTKRRAAINEVLDGVLRERPSNVRVSTLLQKSRR
jgi:hypothetical protein